MGEIAKTAYKNWAGPKYLIFLKRAGHFSFNNGFSNKPLSRMFQGNDQLFSTLNRYSVPFLEHYVVDKKIEVPDFDTTVITGQKELP